MNTPEEEKKKLTFRRLTLCKQFYALGYNNSKKSDPLSKMYAVHNFHISIEIFLRSLFLHFDIRPAKQLNMEFEAMLNEIDKYFKTEGKTLLHRQEIRQLNIERNTVQHHALEPEESKMEYWRVFTYEFLKKSYEQYYSLNFDDFTDIDLIDDELIRTVIRRSSEIAGNGKYGKAIGLLRHCFELSSMSLYEHIPRYDLDAYRYSGNIREINDVISSIEERIMETECLSVILSSGISLIDYTKFVSLTPYRGITIGYNYNIKFIQDDLYKEEDYNWALNTVIKWLISWHSSGFKVEIPEKYRDSVLEIINDRSI